MSSPKFVAILESLVRRTEAGTLKWAEGPNERFYFAALPSYGIMIGERGGDAILQILGKDGQLVEQVTDVDMMPYMANPYTMMITLVNAAHRSAQGVEQALDDILRDLEEG